MEPLLPTSSMDVLDDDLGTGHGQDYRRWELELG